MENSELISEQVNEEPTSEQESEVPTSEHASEQEIEEPTSEMISETRQEEQPQQVDYTAQLQAHTYLLMGILLALLVQMVSKFIHDTLK